MNRIHWLVAGVAFLTLLIVFFIPLGELHSWAYFKIAPEKAKLRHLRRFPD